MAKKKTRTKRTIRAGQGKGRTKITTRTKPKMSPERRRRLKGTGIVGKSAERMVNAIRYTTDYMRITKPKKNPRHKKRSSTQRKKY